MVSLEFLVGESRQRIWREHYTLIVIRSVRAACNICVGGDQ